MKSYIATSCFILFISINSFSQSKFSTRATQVQVEAFGPGSFFSVNFDSRILRKENGLGFRIGLGGSPLGTLGKSCNTGGLMALPAGINYLIGKKKHFAEIGAGGVLIVIGSTKRYCLDFDHGFFSDDTESYLFLTAGYRYQPHKSKGFTYRVFVSPLFQNDFNTKLWGGISIGRRF